MRLSGSKFSGSKKMEKDSYDEWFASDTKLTSALGSSPEDQKSAMTRSISLRKSKVKLKDVAWMADKLAVTQAAGLPTFRSLGMLGRMRQGTPLGNILLDIQQQMGDGRSLGDGMRSHQKSFGPLPCALVDAGEASGALERALRKISDLTGAQVRLRRKIRGAMMYPVSVVVITTALIAALLLFVVPKFAEIYSQAGSELPALTLAIMNASKFAPWIAGAALVAFAVFMLVLRQSKNDIDLRRRLDRMKLKIPVLGGLFRKGADARIASTMANLLAAGVPLLDAIDHASSVANNVLYSEALRTVRQRVADGSTFTAALMEAQIFPDMMVQLASVGEESGALPTLMERYAENAEEEVAQSAEAITSLIEPLMMVVIGLVVGIFLLGLYMPIIEIGDQIK